MFEKYWYIFMIILIIINGSFLALSYMPSNEAGTSTMATVWSDPMFGGGNMVSDTNNTLNIFSTQIDRVEPVDENTLATTTESTDLDIFQSIGFIVGGAISFFSFMQAILFGYFGWIDYLLNPAWDGVVGIGLVGAMNAMLKIIFFIIEIVGLIFFAVGLNPLSR